MTKYTPPLETGGPSLVVSYKLPPDIEVKLNKGQRDFFDALPEREQRQLLKEGGFIPSVSSTAEVRLVFARSGLSRLAGPLKQGRRHALGITVDILKGRYGPITFEDLLAKLEDPDLIEDLHLAEIHPIPIRAVEVDRDEERVTYSAIQQGKRNSASAHYKTKSVTFQ